MTHAAARTDSDFPDSLQRHALLVEYDGTPFNGSQYQHHHGTVLPTVQQALQDAFKSLNIEAGPVHLASRTDAGVHALGQVVHVDMPPDALNNVDRLSRGLNTVLPDAISVKDVALDVGREFHSRKSPKRRWYRYTLLNRPERSALMPPNALWVKDPLDAEVMDTAARILVGDHNFKSFKCPNTPVVDDVCRVEYARVTRDGDNIHFDIVATRFLYKMVRNLMGLLMATGRSRDPVSPKVVREILEKQDQSFASALAPTAKARGLTLMAIQYPPHQAPFSHDDGVQTLNRMITMEFQHNENLQRKAS